MARYYQSTATEPISQFVELPLEFMQGQLDKRKLKRDSTVAQAGAQYISDPWERSETDQALATQYEQQFNDDMGNATDAIVGDDLSSAEDYITKAQQSTGMKIGDDGLVTYNPLTPQGRLEANKEAGSTWLEGVEKMKETGKIGESSAWFNTESTLANYDATRAADPTGMTAFTGSSPIEDVDFQDYADDFATAWNKDGGETFSSNIDGFGAYVGTKGYTQIKEEHVSDFYDQLMENHPQFDDQMYSEWAYDFKGTDYEDLVLNNKEELMDSDEFQTYRNARKESYKDMFANKIGMYDSDLTYSRSIQGDIDVSTGSALAIKQIESGGVTAVKVNGIETSPTMVQDLNDNYSTASITTQAKSDVFTEQMGKLDESIATNLGVVAPFEIFGTTISNPSVDQGGVLSNIIEYQSNGRVKFTDDASLYMTNLGKTTDDMTQIQNAMNEVNSAVDGKEGAQFTEQMLKLQVDNIKQQMVENAVVNWESQYDDLFTPHLGLGLKVDELSSIYPDRESYISDIQNGINPFREMAKGKQTEAFDVLDRSVGGLWASMTAEDKMITFEKAANRFDEDIASYKEKTNEFVASDEYKSSSILQLSNGDGDYGYDAIAQDFKDNSNGTLAYYQNWTNTYGTTPSDEAVALGLDPEQPISEDLVKFAIVNDQPVMIVTMTGKDSKGNNQTVILTPITIDNASQPDFVSSTKEHLSQQYVSAMSTKYNGGTNQAEIDLVSQSYGILNAGEAFYSNTNDLAVGQEGTFEVSTISGDVPLNVVRVTDNQYQLYGTDGNPLNDADGQPIVGDQSSVVTQIGNKLLDMETNTDLSKYDTQFSSTARLIDEDETNN